MKNKIKYIALSCLVFLLISNIFNKGLSILSFKPFSYLFIITCIFLFLSIDALYLKILKYSKRIITYSNSIIIGLTVIHIISLFFVSVTLVSGNSMDKTLDDGELVVVSYIFKKERFDIVIFDSADYDNSSGDLYVKRIIGLPGEIVHYEDNKLYVNNNEVKEDFDNLGTTLCKNNSICNVEIPEGVYLLLGDNRGASQDSRELGFIKGEDIIAQVMFK